MEIAIAVLLVVCGVLLVLLHICTTLRRRLETTLAQCREALERTRREAMICISDALRQLGEHEHAEAKQHRRRVSQQVLRSAGAAMEQHTTPILDMEQDIRQAYGVLQELQDQHRLSSDPVERERLAHAALRTRTELVALLHQYKAATDALCEPMAGDIGEIMVVVMEGE